MSFKIGDRVKVNYPLFGIEGTGVIVMTYDFSEEDPTAIVKLDNGNTFKVPFSCMTKLAEESQEEQESKTEIPVGSKRITKQEYEDALIKVTDPANLLGGDEGNPLTKLLGSMTGAIHGKKLGTQLFGDNDSIVMSEDEFVVAIWNGCSPDNVEFRDKSMRENMVVSIAALMTLQNLPKVIFDGSDNA